MGDTVLDVALVYRTHGAVTEYDVSSTFFGFVPSVAWFVPAVETGIALSIIYAAVIALLERRKAATFVVAADIGLLHGLGFSFVLHEILRVDAPNIWHSLLSFNLGVEIGQIGIVLASWPLFRLIAAKSDKAWMLSRWRLALPCIAIAAIWTGERAKSVLQAL